MIDIRREGAFSFGSFAIGVGVGALAALLLDPRRGAGRRALVREKAFSGARRVHSNASRPVMAWPRMSVWISLVPS